MLLEPCSILEAPLNSGIDCQARMAATSLILLVPIADKWQASDEVDFLAYIETKLHEVPSKRWYAFFGNNAPIRTITDGKESDVTVTYDDGSIGFIRNGTITRTMVTNKGGFAAVKSFLSLNRFNNYALVEVDKFNTVNRRLNADGSFSGLRLNAFYGMTPEMANLKTEFQSGIVINYTVEEYFNNGKISVSDQNLLDIMGLINAQVTKAAAGTATILKIGVQTIGTQNDLVAAYPAIADLTAFKVVQKDTGATITPSAVAIVGGHVELTGVYTSGKTYVVSGTTAAALKALNILGYEITQSVEVAIP